MELGQSGGDGLTAAHDVERQKLMKAENVERRFCLDLQPVTSFRP
jgi:hypothetical protein